MHALGDQDTVLGLGDEGLVILVAQVVPARKRVRLGTDELAGAQAVAVGESVIVLIDKDRLHTAAVQKGLELFGGLGVVGVKGQLGIEGHHLAVLALNNAVLAELEGKADHQEDAAAGDTDDGDNDAGQV